jgi:hypothetical protein
LRTIVLVLTALRRTCISLARRSSLLPLGCGPATPGFGLTDTGRVVAGFFRCRPCLLRLRGSLSAALPLGLPGIRCGRYIRAAGAGTRLSLPCSDPLSALSPLCSDIPLLPGRFSGEAFRRALLRCFVFATLLFATLLLDSLFLS